MQHEAAAAEKRRQTRGVLIWMLLAGGLLAGSSVVVFMSEAGCGVPAPGAADALCNAHACDARVEDIRFELGNCSDRSALQYCFLDVKERAFYEQPRCLSTELARGVRVLFVDVHLQGSRLGACHRWCSVKLASVEEMLSTLAEFLRLNPREVLILWWFPDGDAERIASELELAYVKTGLAQYVFAPEHARWPSMGELVEGNTRLLSITGPAGALRARV